MSVIQNKTRRRDVIVKVDLADRNQSKHFQKCHLEVNDGFLVLAAKPLVVSINVTSQLLLKIQFPINWHEF